MGKGKGKKNRHRSDNVMKMGYGGLMVPYATVVYDNHYYYSKPEETNAIAQKLFGGRYYCYGDRKKESTVEDS